MSRIFPASRASCLAVALALAMAASAAEAQQPVPASPVGQTVARLLALPATRFEGEVRAAAAASDPVERESLLDELSRRAPPSQRRTIEAIRRELALDPGARRPQAVADRPSVAEAQPPSPPADGQQADGQQADGKQAGAASAKRFPTGVALGVGAGVLGLAAAAGGGGSDGAGSSVATPAPPPPPPPPSPPPGGPPESYRTAEFLRNYSLGLVRAEFAYSAGTSGRNVLVAVVDGGLAIDHPEFAGRIHPAGLTLRAGGPAMTDTDGHGTHVAGIIGAAKNDVVMHGVAYNAQLLPIKYIKDENNADSQVVSFSEMINSLLANRPRIANNSWGERTLIDGNKDVYHATRLQDVNPRDYAGVASAYARVLQNGTVVVFSSGNNVTGDPSKGLQPGVWAALPQAYPELRGLWLAVASVGADGLITTTSHRCGDAAAWCLAAPGSRIVSTWFDGQYAIASGTSMAAPHVSGGLALLAELFPTLSSRQLVERLLVSANKTGVYADQATYGQGLLNLQAATQPIGSVSAASEAGVIVLGSDGVYEGGLIGDALGSVLRDVDVVLKDSLDAPFVYAADAVLLGRRQAPYTGVFDALARLQADAFGSRRALDGASWMEYRPAGTTAGRHAMGEGRLQRVGQNGVLSVGVGGDPSWSMGLMHVVDGLRDAGIAPAFANPFMSTQPAALSAAWHGIPTSMGTFGVQVSHDGAIQHQRADRLPMLRPGSSASVLGEWRTAAAHPRRPGVGVQAGWMHEDSRALGDRGALWQGATAATVFAGVDLHWPLAQHVDLLARYHVGSTRLDVDTGGGVFELQARGYALGLRAQPAAGWEFGAVATAPLAVDGGNIRLMLPTMLRADNTLAWERIREPIALGVTPRDFELFVGWTHPNGRVRVKGAFAHQRHPLHGLGPVDNVLLFNVAVR